MMKSLLSSLALLLPLLAFSQRTFDPVPIRSVLSGSKDLGRAKVVTDTIFPGFFESPCSDTAQIFSLANDGGFVMGTNAFGDLLKGQRFIHTNDGPFVIDKVNVAFALLDSSALDRSVSIDIFNDPLSGGEFLGTSDSILVRDLVITSGFVDYTEFSFSDSIVMANDSFIIMVDLSDTYTDTSTFMAIYQSDNGCGDGSNAFEFFIDQNDDVAFGTIAGNWNSGPDMPLNSEMYAFVVIDQEPPTSTRQLSADYQSRVAPNPTSGPATIDFRARTAGDYRAILTDLNGRNLFDARLGNQFGQSRFNLDLSDLPAGLYLYHLDGPEGRQTGKLIKR